MSDLNKCKRDGCNPVQQSRGQMKPEDHHAQFMRWRVISDLVKEHGVLMDVGKFYADAHEVENDAENAQDMRVSCSKCGKATGWMRRDIEEYRRHGDGDYRRYITVRDGNLDLVKQRWNEKVNGHGDR